MIVGGVEFRPCRWRDGSECSDYFVSAAGAFFSFKRGKIRWLNSGASPRKNNPRCAYRSIGMHQKSLWEIAGAHVLVARSWIGMPPGGEFDPEVNHKDGVKHHNHYLNLEWTTKKGNSEHASETGLSPKGERNGTATLTEKNIQCIRFMFSYGWEQSRLAILFKTTDSTISTIILRQHWLHVPDIQGIRITDGFKVTPLRSVVKRVSRGGKGQFDEVLECGHTISMYSSTKIPAPPSRRCRQCSSLP